MLTSLRDLLLDGLLVDQPKESDPDLRALEIRQRVRELTPEEVERVIRRGCLHRPAIDNK